jgi:hypothetical protein
LVKRNGKLGFIDKDGNEVVPTKYDEIGSFGFIKKNWAQVKINDKLAFIDKKGNEIN